MNDVMDATVSLLDAPPPPAASLLRIFSIHGVYVCMCVGIVFLYIRALVQPPPLQNVLLNAR